MVHPSIIILCCALQMRIMFQWPLLTQVVSRHCGQVRYKINVCVSGDEVLEGLVLLLPEHFANFH